MLTCLLILTIPTSAISLIYVRWEYRKRQKLSLIGLGLLCLMLFVPNLVIHYAAIYELPATILDYVGIITGFAGIALCISSIRAFHNLPKVLCVDPGQLTISGPYRWSRNPQYLGWFIFLLGFVISDWSLYGFAAVLIVAISLHILVLIEEEHLHRAFGDQYAAFCRRIPRYFGREHETDQEALS